MFHPPITPALVTGLCKLVIDHLLAVYTRIYTWIWIFVFLTFYSDKITDTILYRNYAIATFVNAWQDQLI